MALWGSGVRIPSAPPSTTRFSRDLPASLKGYAMALYPAGLLAGEMSNSEHPVILLAEDNDDDVAQLRRAFLKAGIDLPLQVVPNGEEAIAYLTGEGRFSNRAEYPLPDLFLLDL